jgi:hypothetical protein
MAETSLVGTSQSPGLICDETVLKIDHEQSGHELSSGSVLFSSLPLLLELQQLTRLEILPL